MDRPGVATHHSVGALGVLSPLLLAAAALSFYETLTPLLRNLLTAVLLGICLAQILAHALLTKNAYVQLAPFSVFQLTIMFIYLVNAVGFKRGALISITSSVCYLLMEHYYIERINYLHVHSLILGNIAGFAVGRVFDRTLRNLFNAEHSARTASLEDPLTRLANRRAALAYLDACLRTARAEQRTLTVVMIDIDHFKQINDRLGHAYGDSTLCTIATVLKKLMHRPMDFVGRLGGEEFILIGLDVSRADAARLANHCCSEVFNAEIAHPVNRWVTVSTGAWTGIPSAIDRPETILGSADAAMYQAKNQGRNRAVVTDSSAENAAMENPISNNQPSWA